jgi:SAM-dependent methyltransferase
MNAKFSEKNPEDWCADECFWQDIAPLIFPAERIAGAKEEVAQLLSLLRPLPSRPLTVLDVGCGIGRHCVEFAREGHKVIGVDYSAYFLQQAKLRADTYGVQVDFRRTDMREMDFSAHCDLALSLYSSFGYFVRPEDDVRVLEKIYRSLKSGGKFVMEIGSKETIARSFSPLQRFAEDEHASFLHRIVVDGWEQLDLHWFIAQQEGYKKYRTRVRIYSGSELKALLKHVGFSQVQLFGNLSGAPFDAQATRLVMVGEKS